MQTFLPYANFTQSAQALDNRRLGKQLVEVQQILKALSDPDYGWQNHPAVKMWRGYDWALAEYGVACYGEWITRYYKGKRGGKPYHKSGVFIAAQNFNLTHDIKLPPWLGGPIHASHRAALKHKDPEYYAGFEEAAELSYHWPSRQVLDATGKTV
jgi:hypothetical protein